MNFFKHFFSFFSFFVFVNESLFSLCFVSLLFCCCFVDCLFLCVLCVRACLCSLLDRGRLTTSDEDSEWAMDPLHMSQLKELYRRDRAKNKKGNVSRKSKIVQYRTKTTATVQQLRLKTCILFPEKTKLKNEIFIYF